MSVFLKKMIFSIFFTIISFFLLIIRTAHAEPTLFSAPLDCVAGKECLIQQYVDLDPLRSFKDYSCGNASYDGHKGTDFRLLNAQLYHKGVAVIASAPGTVLRFRDGVSDKRIASKADLQNVKGKECGNGVVIDHGQGFVGQYCHLKRGSISVKPGQILARGDKIGLVGLSGKTQMPHVHLTLRYKGKVVDPFVGILANKRSCGMGKAPLWTAKVLSDFPYQTSQILEAGFTSHQFQSGGREALVFDDQVGPSSAKLLFFVRLINFQKGDVLSLSITDPQGSVFAKQKYQAPNRNKARYMGFVGKKRRAGNDWVLGRYVGNVVIYRDGTILRQRRVSVELK